MELRESERAVERNPRETSTAMRNVMRVFGSHVRLRVCVFGAHVRACARTCVSFVCRVLRSSFAPRCCSLLGPRASSFGGKLTNWSSRRDLSCSYLQWRKGP